MDQSSPCHEVGAQAQVDDHSAHSQGKVGDDPAQAAFLFVLSYLGDLLVQRWENDLLPYGFCFCGGFWLGDCDSDASTCGYPSSRTWDYVGSC